ncbi:glucose 1-dehydrogenase [candidate division KSB1 bacterium]|nr:glucose 1-dehydrogenase [candidate division KSB1 bacterium]
MSTLPNFDLTGKVALVTGASRGIGEAIASTYAAAGAKVVITSRKQENLDVVADKIRSDGGNVLAIAAHTGDSAAIQELMKRVNEEFGGVDILVNNAATNPHFGPILTSEETAWDKTFDINLKGYFRMAKACVESMKNRGGGKIINMSSVAGKKPQPGMGVYCLTKAAVIMLTEILAVELASDNIQVNAIAPGFIKTRFSQAIWDNEKFSEQVTKSIPQKRFATVEELLGIALYLASDASSYTTGSTFVVDGGMLVGDTI